MNDLCASIHNQLGTLFACAPVNEYVRVRTPFLYPDGDVIDVFAKQQSDGTTLTDLGETLRWLRMQSVAQRCSPKQRQLIEDTCLNHGVEFFKGMLMLRVSRREQISEALVRLAQACLRTSDIWFTLRTRAIETIIDEVEGLLTERNVRFARAERVPGRSGRVWQPDFHTRTPRQSSFVFVLSTGSKTAARAQSEHVLSACHDLSHYAVGPEAIRFVSLFDDTVDVWREEDFKLVGDLADIALWSRPDEFLNKIAA
jgi:hypothetical protein